jgi:Ca2+-binding RTX toxin-like protein
MLACLPMLVTAAMAGHQATQASFSDYQNIKGNTVGAAVWRPDPPAACGPVSNYDGVIYGTFGDDVINGGNHPQIIMGLGGNDTIHAGNSGDCLVGGNGNDKLYGGNAKDILIGGGGNDYLNGENGIDTLDGGSGDDTCVGGRAPDISTNCESVS